MFVKLLLAGVLVAGLVFAFTTNRQVSSDKNINSVDTKTVSLAPASNPMSILSLRERSYPGSDIKIEETLSPGSNYSRYIASYQSDGNKIFGLLTVPSTTGQENGYPVIVFLHGYIAPSVYRTTERYVAYQDGLARNGFITYKIDLRGHGDSEGEAVNGHFSESYVVDTLNAISSLKKYSSADAGNIGVWGHSNGGEIGLRVMAVSKEVKAGVFWAGVVGSTKGMLETYNGKISFLNITRSTPDLIKQNGLPSENPEFWNLVDPYFFLEDIDGAIQLHHGTGDDSVPIETSVELKNAMEEAGKTIEYYEYSGADHNLGGSAFGPAMQRSVEFFKRYLNRSNL